jgi:hypothetical protein
VLDETFGERIVGIKECCQVHFVIDQITAEEEETHDDANCKQSDTLFNEYPHPM